MDKIVVSRKLVAPGELWPWTYTSREGYGMLAATDHIHLSDDNGETWKVGEELSLASEDLGDNRARQRGIVDFYLDPDNGMLLMFIDDSIVTNGIGFGEGETPTSTRRIFTRISGDGGRTWAPEQQFIEKGEEYDATHYARDVYSGKNCLVIMGQSIIKLRNGTVIAPAYGWATEEHRKMLCDREGLPLLPNCYIRSACFFGRWKKDLSAIEWESGDYIDLPVGYTSAGNNGSDEPTIAVLDEKRVFMVVRTGTLNTSYSPEDPRYPAHIPTEDKFRKRGVPVLRYCALSEDGGRTWGTPRPLTYSDGSVLYSPSSYPRFIRSSKNGKWYLIANLLDEPTYGLCDPRHPLQIAELDCESLGIIKESVAIIEDKGPEDPETVRFSNFAVYEDRRTKDFILLMTKAYLQTTPNRQELPHPTYRYRIQVPD